MGQFRSIPSFRESDFMAKWQRMVVSESPTTRTGPVLVAYSLCPGQVKGTMYELEVEVEITARTRER